jgi:hypothetical protein
MKTYQIEVFHEAAENQGRQIKFLLNENGIGFFPVNQQHREVNFPGLSYAEDYRGDALAGIYQSGHAEIRFHQKFSDERVKTLWQKAETALPRLASAVQMMKYQGRRLK